MSRLWDLVPVALLAAGVGLELVAVLGICVMRSAYDRLHYAGLVGFGALLVGLSILCSESFSLIGDKAAATGVWVVLAGPVVAQTTVRSLRTRALGDWRDGIEEYQETDL